MRAFRPLVLRWRVCSAGCCCGGFAAGALLGGCALWTRVGCMACVSRGCVCPAWCRCGGFGRRCALGLAVPLELGLVHGRRLARVRLSCRVQLRRLCRRCALGLAVPLGFGWVHGLRLALARLSCGCSCGGFGRRCALGLAVPFGFWLGAWPASCVGAFVLPGAAATLCRRCVFGLFCGYPCGEYCIRGRSTIRGYTVAALIISAHLFPL